MRAWSYLCSYFCVGMVSAATHALQLAICLLSFSFKCDVSLISLIVFFLL